MLNDLLTNWHLFYSMQGEGGIISEVGSSWNLNTTIYHGLLPFRILLTINMWPLIRFPFRAHYKKKTSQHTIYPTIYWNIERKKKKIERRDEMKKSAGHNLKQSITVTKEPISFDDVCFAKYFFCESSHPAIRLFVFHFILALFFSHSIFHLYDYI